MSDGREVYVAGLKAFLSSASGQDLALVKRFAGRKQAKSQLFPKLRGVLGYDAFVEAYGGQEEGVHQARKLAHQILAGCLRARRGLR